MNRRPTRNNPANNKPFVSGGVISNFTASNTTAPEPTPVPTPAPVSFNKPKWPLNFTFEWKFFFHKISNVN